MSDKIARVNRVFKDKEGGLIVDYVGIASALKAAMKEYTKRDQSRYGDMDIAKVAYPKFQESVALFLIFFLTLGFLCVKHETFTVNIVLEVFGYQFYRCDLEDEDGNGITWMIISRTDLKGCVGDSVYLRPLNNECRLNASTR